MTDLPKDWCEVSLKDVCSLITDGSHFSPPTAEAGFPYITVRDLSESGIDFANCKFISDESYAELMKNGCKPNVGDVLFSKDGTVGKVAIVPAGHDFVVLSSLAILRPKVGEIEPTYLKWAMMSPGVLESALGMKTGTAIRRVVLRNLKTIELPLPPLNEQARIVEILEEQFSRLDSALASIKVVREKAQAFRRSLLQAAFSGELTGGTQGWQKVSLIDAAEVVMGQSPPGSSYNEVGVGKPFFQGKAEFGDRYPTVKKWTTAGTKSALAGDILMSVRAPVGPTNIANVDCVIGRGLAAIRAKAITNQTYLLWTLRSIESDIAAKGVGTTFSSISGSALRSTSLALPPLSIQARIVEVLEEQFSRLDNALEVTNELEERIAAERRSLLHSAFSGTLTASWRENNV